MFSKHFPLSLLLGSVFLMGCPKKQATPGEGENLNPQVEFVQGVKTLQKVDKKTGAVDYATALAYFRSAVNLKPDFAHASFNAAWTAEQMGKTEDSIEFYRKAYQAKPNNEFLFALADALTTNGQAEEAVELYRSYIEQNPTDYKVRYSLITALTESGKPDEALTEASEILTKNPEDITVYRLLSRAFYQNEQFDMSLLCAEKANEMLVDKAKKTGDPEKKDAGILNNMGVTYLTKEDETSAISIFQEAISIEPNHVEANLNLGFLSLNSGNYGYALERFDATLVSDPANLNAKIGKAVALRGVQDFEGAQKLYKQILSSDSQSKTIYFNASILQAKYLKNYKEAQKLLEAYQTKNPEDTEVNSRLANISELQAEEARRKAEEEAKKKAEEERIKRQKEQMAELTQKVNQLKASSEELASCAEAVESGAVEMAQMVLEQGQMVVEAGEIEMAGDVMPFIEDSQSSLDAMKETCAGGGAAPDEAPATEEGTAPEEVPAPEETPAPEEVPAPE